MWPILAGMALGAASGYLGRDSNQTISQNSNTQQSGSNYGESTFAPHWSASPGYGFMAGNMQQLMQEPVPFFPGAPSGPNAPQQIGTALQMGSIPGQLEAANTMYNQAGASQPWYQQAANMGGMAADAYGQAGNMYSQAAGMASGVTDAYNQSGNLAMGAIGNQQGLNNTSLGNYNFLSNAADVANNPYVQNQLAANKSEVMEGLMREAIPQINSSAASVNNLGSSRQGLLQGQAVGDAAEALARVNANTMMDAYGQGLGAQQSALGQTGAMLNNQLAPAQSAGFAADQRLQGMQAAGLGANYMGQGAQQLGLGQQMLGNSGDLTQRGLSNYMNNMQGMQGFMQGATNAAYGAGAQVQSQNDRMFDWAQQQHAYQYAEPWDRMGRVAQTLGVLQPLGRQQTINSWDGSRQSSSQQPNPNYQSAGQAILGGAAAGAGAFSDRRLKRNVEQIGTTPAGYPWYRFEYLWGEPGEGVMSDEVPAAWVQKHSSGYDMVDYTKVR